MLRKLLKYEIKATARKFLPLYGAILGTAILVGLSVGIITNDLFRGLTIFVLVVLFASLGVLTLMTIIQRFKNNLLSDEGYLMFTLPVTTEKLILSKLITALIWAAVSMAVSFISFLIIMAGSDVNIFHEIVRLFKENSYFFEIIRGEHILIAFLVLLCLTLQFVYFVLLVYGSLSIGQLPVFNKHRGIASFIAFIVTSIVLGTIVESLFSNLFNTMNMLTIENVTKVLSVGSLTNLSLAIIMFFATDYLLKRHLNIE